MQNISILIGHHFLLDSWAPLYFFPHFVLCPSSIATFFNDINQK